MASSSDEGVIYRRPADEPHGAPRGPEQPIGAWTLGVLGEVSVDLELGSSVAFAVDRRRLEIDPGAGLWVRGGVSLPPVHVRRVAVELGPIDLKIDAEALGPALPTIASALLVELVRLRFGVTPSASQTAVDLALGRLPATADGRRALVTRGPASLTIDPASELRGRVSGLGVEVTTTRPIEARALGLKVRAVGLRYDFGERRITLAAARGRWAALSWLALTIVAWALTRWLRPRLRGPLGAPGYDLWADEARARSVAIALRGLGVIGADAAPAERSRISPQELLARLRCASPPGGAWLLAKLPLGTGSSIGLGLADGDTLSLELDREALRLRAGRGLFAVVDGLPALSDLRVRGIDLRLADTHLTIDAAPPFGAFERALAESLIEARLLPGLPAPVRALLGDQAVGPAPRLDLAIDVGGGRTLRLRADEGATLEVEHGPARTELRCAPGIELVVDGLDLVPPITLRRLTYAWSDGAITLDTAPELGPLEESLLTHLVRHLLAPRVPASLGLPVPKASAPIDLSARHLDPEALWAGVLPGVGRVEVLADRADTIVVGLTREWLDAASSRGVLLVAADLRLVFAIERIAVERESGTVSAVAEPMVGPYLDRLLGEVYRQFAAPQLAKALPPPPSDPAAPWVVVERPIDGGTLRVTIAPGDRVELRRNPAHLELRAAAGLTIEAPQAPPIRVDAIAWWPGEDRWDLSLEPSSGPFVAHLVGRLAHRHGAAILARVAALAHLPAIAASPPPPPPPPGLVLFRRDVPGIGKLHLALLRDYHLEVIVDAGGAIDVSVHHGVRVRLRDLALRLVLLSLRASIDPWTLSIVAEPELGHLERVLVLHLLRPHLERARAILWPPVGEHEGARVLLEVAADAPWGPLRLALPAGARVALRLDAQVLEIEAPAGLHVALGGVGWLPDLQLRHLLYRLEDGAIELDFGGIDERYYHEAESVSPITEAIVAHLLKVLVSPHIPAIARDLGVRAFPLPAVPVLPEGAIELVRVPIGDLGEATVSMPAAAKIVVSSADDEVVFECAAGLLLMIPGLRLSVQIRGARFHTRSGEVQLGGLGQLENAIIEAMLRQNFAAQAPAPAPPIAEAAAIAETTPIAAFFDGLAVGRDGRRILFTSTAVAVTMAPSTRFTLTLGARGIDFSATPPLMVDGPGVLDYEFGGLHYDFATAKFAVMIAEDGALAGLFSGVVADKAAKGLGDQLSPLLPPAMREPGYDLAADPRSAEHIAAVIANFGARADAKA